MYQDLFLETKGQGCLVKLIKADANLIDGIKKSFSGIPDDYILFLEEIGSGEIGNNNYMLYNGLLLPDEIYDADTADDLQGILIFGDDMQGNCYGFKPSNEWSIVEIDSSDMNLHKVSDCFSEFIRGKVKDLQ